MPLRLWKRSAARRRNSSAQPALAACPLHPMSPWTPLASKSAATPRLGRLAMACMAYHGCSRLYSKARRLRPLERSGSSRESAGSSAHSGQHAPMQLGLAQDLRCREFGVGVNRMIAMLAVWRHVRLVEGAMAALRRRCVIAARF